MTQIGANFNNYILISQFLLLEKQTIEFFYLLGKMTIL